MRVLLVVLLTLPALAGCLSGSTPTPTDAADAAPQPPTTHVLVGTAEPTELAAPTFTLLGAVASGGPVYGAGEPSVWAGLDGTVYVAFPGCDRAFYLASLPTDTESCGHGLVYETRDDGATWTRLNRDGDGRYSDDGPDANGDADVAVDSAGTVYASNLGGGGIQLHARDLDGTWSYLGNVVPPTEDPGDDPELREGADRQWLAAAGPGHVINAWMRTSPDRDVAVNTTFDGGATWTGTTYFGDDIGWLGTVQFAPDGRHAYVPYTQPLATPAALLYGGVECAMHVVVTDDGGATWRDVDTGARWFTSDTGGHWSCVQMAPGLDVTGDGTVVVAWAQDEFVPESQPPYTATSASTILYAVASRDNGTRWSEPQSLTTPNAAGLPFGTSVMAWVTGGAGDRFAVTYLHNPVPTDGDYTAAAWDVRAIVLDGFGTDGQRRVDAVVEERVHAGGICTRGGACILTGSDRAFLDFFEADLLPDGRLVVTYPHDLNPSKTIEIRVAIQSGGTPLALPVPTG